MYESPYGKIGIYEIRNKVSGDAYVGSSRNIGRRWSGHIHRLEFGIHPNDHLQRAWNNYGRDSFQFSILELCLLEDIVACEQKYLDSGAYVYNKAKFAENPMKGNKLSDAHREAFCMGNRGKVRSPETRAKMSAAQKAIASDPAVRERRRQNMLGRAMPQEVKDKLRAIRTGVKMSPTHLEAFRVAMEKRRGVENCNPNSLANLGRKSKRMHEFLEPIKSLAILFGEVKKLAEEVGASEVSVYNWGLGKGRPGKRCRKSLLALCVANDIPTGDL